LVQESVSSKIFKSLCSGCSRKRGLYNVTLIINEDQAVKPIPLLTHALFMGVAGDMAPPKFKCAVMHLGPAISHRYNLHSNCFTDRDMGII